MWTMRCSKSDIKLFRSCFLFFLSLVNKYCLTHSVLVVSRLEKKKKKHTWVCWLHTLGDVSFSSTTSTSPTDVQLFRGLQTDQLNLINIQVKITFLGLCLQHSPLILILKMFSRRQLEVLNPQEHCWKTSNLTSSLAHRSSLLIVWKCLIIQFWKLTLNQAIFLE